MSDEYDVAVIGAGTAGLAALREIKKRTPNFLVINDGPYGTTCARVGCMPSKALIEAAKAFHRRHAFAEFGISGADALQVDMRAVLRRVRRLRDDFVRSTLAATDELGERSIAGRARLRAPGILTVADRTIHAKRIVIATGSRPVLPEPWRALGERLLTSETLFEQTDLPPRLAVIGLGPVGAELAQALARLGIEVTGFSADGGIGGLSDPEVIEAGLSIISADVPLHLESQVEPSMEEGDVRIRREGAPETRADKLLVAVGRHPNVEHLGLEALGVPLDERGLPPYDPSTLQVGDLPVFMAGDVNERRPLLHEAADDGYIAGRNAIASTPEAYERRAPLSIVFTDPEIAIVGSRFADLMRSEVLIGTARFERQGRARTAARNRGILRAYADRQTGRLIGAELCAPDGGHLAHLLGLALQHELTVREILRMPFYHPVLEEGLRTALRDISRQLPEAASSDLAGCSNLNIEALE
jgi:dihydrolipoamide dehydrogenase